MNISINNLYKKGLCRGSGISNLLLISCRYVFKLPVDTYVSIKISSAYAELVQMLYYQTMSKLTTTGVSFLALLVGN